jgi:hypothetical protein
MLVGRAREFARLARGLVDVPVALICGVPGIGKSMLVAGCSAAWPGPAIRVELAAGASIAHLVDTVHRQLGAKCGELAADAIVQLDGLWSLLDGAAALLVIDDLHCLPPAVRVAVLNTAARRLRAGRLVAASRELVPVGDGTPDRLQHRGSLLQSIRIHGAAWRSDRSDMCSLSTETGWRKPDATRCNAVQLDAARYPLHTALVMLYRMCARDIASIDSKTHYKDDFMTLTPIVLPSTVTVVRFASARLIASPRSASRARLEGSW